MSRGMMITGLSLVSAFNIALLIINMSSPSKGQTSAGAAKTAPSKAAPAKPPTSAKAAGAVAKYQQLIRDPDFNRAVRDIIQECTVNVDLAKVEC